MQRHGLEGINLDNPLDGKLPKLIEYFVDFYGEKYREKITSSLSSAIYVFAENSSQKDVETLKKHFDRIISANYFLGVEEDNVYLEEEKQKYLQYFENRPLRRYAKEFKETCQNFVAIYLKELFKLPSECMPKLKYLALEYISLIDLEKGTTDSIVYKKGDEERLSKLISTLVELKGEKEEKGCSKETRAGLKTLLSIRRINLLKEQIYQMKYDSEKKVKYAMDIFLKPIKQANLIWGEDICDNIEKYLLNRDGLVAMTTITADPNNPDKMVCVCLNNEALLLDNYTFVHELNHIVSSNFVFDGDIIDSKTGITANTFFFYNRNKTMEIDEHKNRYIALNEVINDYLSCKIADKMKKDRFQIGAMEKVESLYSTAFPLFGGFIEKHFEEIKACHLSERSFELERLIGSENFNSLADLATKMIDKCKTSKYGEIFREKLAREAGVKRAEFDLFKLAKDENFYSKTEHKEYLDFFREGEKLFEKIDKAIENQSKNSENVDENEMNEDNIQNTLEENISE